MTSRGHRVKDPYSLGVLVLLLFVSNLSTLVVNRENHLVDGEVAVLRAAVVTLGTFWTGSGPHLSAGCVKSA